jgi:uncharacterized protein YaiL (DUF2058 family)
MTKLVSHHKGGKHHNMTRSSHNDDTKKYEKQAIRTDRNKARHIEKAKKLKAKADQGKAEKKLKLCQQEGVSCI